jgi:uncharacterized membrane protein
MTASGRERIQSIDALRGLCVVLMCVHHLLYDLCAFLGAPWWLFSNPVFDALHYCFAGCFILLSGVSSRFSRSNIRRGGKVMAVALALTLLTWAGDRLALRFLGEELGILIVFGVLHLLGFCMLFYGLTRKLWDRLPDWLAPALYILLIVLLRRCTNGGYATDSPWLFPFGFVRADFASADYFPILPWVFVFLLGAWLGEKIRQHRFPEWFYTAQFPFFPKVGRHALLIYILHQPILAGLTLLIGAIFGIL